MLELLGHSSFSGDSSCWVGSPVSGTLNWTLTPTGCLSLCKYSFLCFCWSFCLLESLPSGSSGHFHCCLHTSVLYTDFTAHVFCWTWRLLCRLLCRCCITQGGTCCCSWRQPHVCLCFCDSAVFLPSAPSVPSLLLVGSFSGLGWNKYFVSVFKWKKKKKRIESCQPAFHTSVYTNQCKLIVTCVARQCRSGGCKDDSRSCYMVSVITNRFLCFVLFCWFF